MVDLGGIEGRKKVEGIIDQNTLYVCIKITWDKNISKATNDLHNRYRCVCTYMF